MPLVSSQAIQSIQTPTPEGYNGINFPDRIPDPFTVAPLDWKAHSEELKELQIGNLMDTTMGYVPGADEAYNAMLAGEAAGWIFHHITQATQRLTAAKVMTGPNGKDASRVKRPDDFVATADAETAPMKPQPNAKNPDADPYELSPFWHTKIDTATFPATAVYADAEGNEIARSFPNSFPFMDAQELITFPNTKAVSISQLNEDELRALGELMQDRFKAMKQAGKDYVWFGMHRGRDGGGTLEHLHFQVYGSTTPPRDYGNIWANESLTGFSHHDFLTQDGDLVITENEDRNTQTYAPFTGGFPLGTSVAFAKKTTSYDGEHYTRFEDMTSDELVDWLASVAESVAVLESLPLAARPNGMAGYSLECVVPRHNASPVTWSVNPAKLRSVPFEQAGGLENPIHPANAVEILTPHFVALDL